MTRKAMDNFRERLQESLINNCQHLSDVILKVFEKNASYVLFINKTIVCVPCFIWFLLTFKLWELFLPHPVVHLFDTIHSHYIMQINLYENIKYITNVCFGIS